MKITLYKKEDNYESAIGTFRLIDRNIVFEKDKHSVPKGMEMSYPANGKRYVQYSHSYSPVYDDNSDGAVNTRIVIKTYLENGKAIPFFCKLNWFERLKLNHINKKAIYHKHPIAFWGLTANLLFAFINIVLFFADPRDLKKEEKVNQLMQSQVELLEVHERMLDDYLNTVQKKDTLKSK